MGKDIQGKKDLIFLPIAHLSPVCAYRVRRVIESTEFDTLFVELPREAHSLFPALVDGRTKLPVSLLFRNDDGETVLPLTEYSPEYVAVKTANELGKRIIFIDSAAYFRAQPRSESAAMVIEEVTGGVYDSARFFDAMDEFAANFAGEITEREASMASVIENTEYKRAIVVVGATHLASFKRGVTVSVKPRPWTGNCYIIPYIPDGSSVVRYGYNAALYKRLGESTDPFNDAAMDCLIKHAKKVTADYPFEHVPVTDIINTLVHMRMLAEMRGKRFAGFDELMESAGSVIDKGDEQSVKRHALRSVTEVIPEGELAPGFATPLAEDFRRCLNGYSIRGDSGSRVTLQILENPSHRQKSAFLRRLSLLIDDGFATFESGADYAQGKDLNKVREIWRINSAARAITRLTYVSHLGATVAEAAQHKLDDMLAEAEDSDAPKLASIYMQAYFLGLDGRSAFDALSEGISHICEFGAAVAALSHLVYLLEIKRTFDGAWEERDIIVARSLYGKALELLSGLWLSEAGEKNASSLAKLNGIANTAEYLEADRLTEALFSVPPYAEPCLCGCACALIGKGGDIVERLENYAASAKEAADVAMFFLGCAIGDRGLLTDKRIIRIAASFIESLTREEFMDASPSLRYAFSFLKLAERNDVRKAVGELYGESEPLFFADDELLLKDEYLARQIQLYGLNGVAK